MTLSAEASTKNTAPGRFAGGIARASAVPPPGGRGATSRVAVRLRRRTKLETAGAKVTSGPPAACPGAGSCASAHWRRRRWPPVDPRPLPESYISLAEKRKSESIISALSRTLCGKRHLSCGIGELLHDNPLIQRGIEEVLQPIMQYLPELT